jgi:hypothetical protein
MIVVLGVFFIAVIQKSTNKHMFLVAFVYSPQFGVYITHQAFAIPYQTPL